MTAAGLREFVADTAAGEDSSLAAVHGELSTAFTIRPEPGAAGSGTHRQTWLDTFVGALAVALAGGIPAAEAVRAASAAAATAATRPGAQAGMPRPEDVLATTGVSWPTG